MSSEAALKFTETLIELGEVLEAKDPFVETSVSHVDQQRFDTLSDESLLQAVGDGSKDALGVVFRRHGRAVLNVAWRILRDEAEADDLRQEVFLYLFERAAQYDPAKSSASSWIIQITYHRALDRHRFLTARQHYKSEGWGEQHVGDDGIQPSTDHIDGKALLAKLRSELTPDQLKTLELHFFEGYSFSEIAEKSGQSVGNIRHHYYRALDRLRSSIFSKKRGQGERIGNR